VTSLAVLRPGEPLAAVPSIGRAVGVEPRVAAREAEFTRALYERHARHIYSYCLHQLSSREEAEDAVQTTFMNAFRGLKRGVVPESEQAWLFKIAENVCLSRRRSTWRRGRVESPNDLEVLQEIVPSRGSRADELIGLEDALEAMPENQRRAILLREWQGLSYREIADELAISQAAVETLIFRARRTLAQGLEDSPSSKRRVLSRSANGFSAGSLLTALKSALTGGAAVKAVAVAVAAGTATVAATHAPKSLHLRHAHAAPVRSSKPSSAEPARTHAGAVVELRSARTSKRHATKRTSRLHTRSVTTPVVAADGKSVSPPADAPTATSPGPTAPPAAPAPADPSPVTPPPEPQQPVGTGDHNATPGANENADRDGQGNAYGHDKKPAEQTPPQQPAAASDKPKGNGKKDAAPPAPPAVPQTPPATPASPPPAAAPPGPADAAPAAADDHGNGHADDADHGGGAKGKDK
jgi:RNA polymerase sigma factor (sigma-70 family)